MHGCRGIVPGLCAVLQTDAVRPVLAVLVVLAGVLGSVSRPAEPTRPHREPIPLFNGRDLAGFHTWLVDSGREDPRKVFTVTNHMIRISGEGLGYLATDREYADYHLSAEFRWGGRNWSWGDRIGKARDSGIFLHATGQDGNSVDGKGAFMAAIECNVFQGATGDFLLIRGKDSEGVPIAPRVRATVSELRDPDGWFTWAPDGRSQTIETWGRLNWFAKDRNWSDQLDFRGSRDLETPGNGWTRVECICKGSRITIRINGTVANEVFDVWPSRGRILLQCEGSEIFWRNLRILPLEFAE